MKEKTIKEIEKKMSQSFPEIRIRLKALTVNPADRVRVIFEFEFKKKKITEALEIRHRRSFK